MLPVWKINWQFFLYNHICCPKICSHFSWFIANSLPVYCFFNENHSVAETASNLAIKERRTYLFKVKNSKYFCDTIIMILQTTCLLVCILNEPISPRCSKGTIYATNLKIHVLLVRRIKYRIYSRILMSNIKKNSSLSHHGLYLQTNTSRMMSETNLWLNWFEQDVRTFRKIC